ncbi:MAG: hypothetical protein JRJ65_01725 [Deltaproteobacteria bacterium]|nr:hypothetical protein [Deltaproteobacteria bacterium]
MGKNYKIVAVIVISLIVIGFFLSIYISVEETIPGNAVVVVTLEDKLYHSIHFDHICVDKKTAQTMTLSRALADGYKPHSHCNNLGYFKGNRRFLFHHLLSKLGMEINGRWDRDGNWLW